MRGFLENLWARAAAYNGCDFVAAVARFYPSLTIATVLGAPQLGGVEGIYGIDKLPIIWSGSSKLSSNHGHAPDVS